MNNGGNTLCNSEIEYLELLGAEGRQAREFKLELDRFYRMKHWTAETRLAPYS